MFYNEKELLRVVFREGNYFLDVFSRKVFYKVEEFRVLKLEVYLRIYRGVFIVERGMFWCVVL